MTDMNNLADVKAVLAEMEDARENMYEQSYLLDEAINHLATVRKTHEAAMERLEAVVEKANTLL